MTREEAIDWLARLKSNTVNHTLDMPLWWNEPLAEALDMAIKALEQESKTGHWINLKDTYGDIVESVCSNCDHNGVYKWKYCTNCGAKMESEE